MAVSFQYRDNRRNQREEFLLKIRSKEQELEMESHLLSSTTRELSHLNECVHPALQQRGALISEQEHQLHYFGLQGRAHSSHSVLVLR